MQREFADFGELYAPTVASSSVRLLAALTCELDLELCHFEVDRAFVRADLEEDVFMRLPQGCGELSGKVVKLNESLRFETSIKAVVCDSSEVSFGFGL